jgi:hypothetical protein
VGQEEVSTGVCSFVSLSTPFRRLSSPLSLSLSLSLALSLARALSLSLARSLALSLSLSLSLSLTHSLSLFLWQLRGTGGMRADRELVSCLSKLCVETW